MKRKAIYSNSYMPWELVIETLIRVPVKSAIRFRSLSRSCNALITSPKFIHSHYNQTRSKEESNLILLAPWDLIRETSYNLRVDNGALSEFRTLNMPPHERQFKNLRVLSSCNGLVCLVDKDSLPKDRKIVLWNPSVNKCVVLPRTSSMYLECVALSFGFDYDTKDFKVFRVYQYENRRGAEVYSLRKRSWKAVDVSGDIVAPGSVCRLTIRFQCVYNNVVHHLTRYEPRGCKIMFKFDPRHDSVDMLEIPLLTGDEEGIFVYNGCLAVLEESSFSSIRFCYRVWVLENYGDMSSWINKFVFEMEGKISHDVLGSRKNGEILMWHYNKGLVSYDPETRRISNLLGAAGGGRFISAVTHAESLVLVDEGVELTNYRRRPVPTRCKKGNS